MTEVEIVGTALIGLASVLGLVSALIKMLVSPINEQTISITKLNSTLERIVTDVSKVEATLERHDERIDKLERSEYSRTRIS